MDDYSIIQTVAKVAESFNKGELFNFFYDGIEVRRGKKGYVLALKIVPSEELKRFRKEIYNTLKLVIVQRPDVEEYNENPSKSNKFVAC
nr:hypothetical protein [Sulfolobus islandicus]